MRRYVLPLFILLAGLLPVPFFPQATAKTLAKETALRGRVVCVDASGARVAESDCQAVHRLFALEADGGRVYRFSLADSMAEVFIDPRVRAQEIQVTVRIREKDDVEIIRVQSIKDRKLYDINYFCSVCNITRNALQLCPCCRDEMELVETAARDPEL